MPNLQGIIVHAPDLEGCSVPALLYADDLILLSRSQIGLKRAIKGFMTYCGNELLEIHYDKSTIMIFAKSKKSPIKGG